MGNKAGHESETVLPIPPQKKSARQKTWGKSCSALAEDWTYVVNLRFNAKDEEATLKANSFKKSLLQYLKDVFGSGVASVDTDADQPFSLPSADAFGFFLAYSMVNRPFCVHVEATIGSGVADVTVQMPDS